MTMDECLIAGARAAGDPRAGAALPGGPPGEGGQAAARGADFANGRPAAHERRHGRGGQRWRRWCERAGAARVRRAARRAGTRARGDRARQGAGAPVTYRYIPLHNVTYCYRGCCTEVVTEVVAQRSSQRLLHRGCCSCTEVVTEVVAQRSSQRLLHRGCCTEVVTEVVACDVRARSTI